MGSVKVAGIAGGVGTTVVAALLGGEDLGRDAEHADVIVARNDYRCAKALVAFAPRREQTILLLTEDGRSLTARDIADCTGHEVVEVPCHATIARADDAGILESYGTRNRRHFAELVRAVEQGIARKAVR